MGSPATAGSNAYILKSLETLSTQMIDSLQRITLFALYQFTVALGILLMPVALAARQAGVSLPIGRLIDAVGTAYDDTAAH